LTRPQPPTTACVPPADPTGTCAQALVHLGRIEGHARLWRVGRTPRRILQGREEGAPIDLVNRHLRVLDKLKDVKDEQLHLDPVRLVRLDRPARLQIDVRDLLARNVVRELVLPRLDRLEEGEREEVVRDVGRTEGEGGRGVAVARLREGRRDLRVLDHGPAAVLLGDDADGLGRVRLADDLDAALRLLGDAVAEEGGVGNADEAVVDAVGV
jgi:hypothetical protein